MTHPDIRRLQVLNDLIAQTLDLIAQRSSGLPGTFQGAPFLQDVTGQNVGLWGNQVPYGVPFSTLPQGGWMGHGHLPQTLGQPNVGGYGQQQNVGMFGGQMGIPHPAMLAQAGIPLTQNMPSPGLSHSPWMGQQINPNTFGGRGVEGGIGLGGYGHGFHQGVGQVPGLQGGFQGRYVNPQMGYGYVPGMW